MKNMLLWIGLVSLVLAFSAMLSSCWDADYIKYTSDQAYVVLETEQYERLLKAVEETAQNTKCLAELMEAKSK